MNPTHIAVIILAAIGGTLIGMIVAERIARWQQSRKINEASQHDGFEDEPPDLVAIARARKQRNSAHKPTSEGNAA